MKRITIEMNTENDEFARNEKATIAKYVGEIAKAIKYGAISNRFKDINGNTIGHYIVEDI